MTAMTIFDHLSTQAIRLGHLRPDRAKHIKREVEECRKSLSSQRTYAMGIAGQSGSGKTTLLMALFYDKGLNKVDLPTGLTVTTYIPTIISLRKNPENTSMATVVELTHQEARRAIWLRLAEVAKDCDSELVPWPCDLAALTSGVAAARIMIQAQASRTEQRDTSRLNAVLDECEEALTGLNSRSITGSGEGERRHAIPIDKVRGIIEDPRSAYKYEKISISILVEDLGHDIDIHDLPGFDVSNGVHKEISYAMLGRLDALLIVKSAQPFTETNPELDFRRKISERFKPQDSSRLLRFVVTKYAELGYANKKSLDDPIATLAGQLGVSGENTVKTSALFALAIKNAAPRDDWTDKEKNEHDLDQALKEMGLQGSADGARLKQIYEDECGRSYAKVLDEIGFAKLEGDLDRFLFDELPKLMQKKEYDHLQSLKNFLRNEASQLAHELEPATSIRSVGSRPDRDLELQAAFRWEVFELADQFKKVLKNTNDVMRQIGAPQ